MANDNSSNNNSSNFASALLANLVAEPTVTQHEKLSVDEEMDTPLPEEPIPEELTEPLIQELFIEPSEEDCVKVVNMEESDQSPAIELAHLYEKMKFAEIRTIRVKQDEIMSWYCYRKYFEKRHSEILSGILKNGVTTNKKAYELWEVPSISDSNTYLRFPIRVGQKTKTCLNGRDFYITIYIFEYNHMLPEYCCQSNDIFVIKTNATKAISQTYQKIFQNKTQYSGHVVIGWNDKKLIDILSSTIDFHPFSCQLGEYEIFIYGLDLSTRSDWNKAGDGYKSSIIYKYKKRPAIFVSEIIDNKCYVHIYQDFELQETFVGDTPDDVWKNSGFIQKFLGKQLFGLEDQVTLQKLSKLCILHCTSQEWSNFNLMKKLYEYHLQRRTSANVKWYNLFIRWNQSECNIIELSSELKELYPGLW
ncbi:hypothetical protein C1646_676728 [Rhizophagus diaphanus]|nr:hypothetical protein C1646_676728 [Rhizophagus diaphanus] [Rhizophagus sp. MUCL 43196]